MINGNLDNNNTAESAVPGSFRISEISIQNAYGKEFNIFNQVTKLVITESMYTYGLHASIEILDTVNLFEELRISGQEKVTIIIHKRDKGSKDTIKLKKVFYVTEIPLFGKIKEASQGYTLTCLSEHAFTNKVVSLSRSVKGSISKAIEKVIKNDLQYTGDIFNTADSKGNVSLVIPNVKPFKAVDWLLRRSFDESSSPIFAYETLNGFYIIPYKEIATSKSIGTYSFTFRQNDEETTEEGYNERKYKVLAMASNLNSSKFHHSGRGAYASTTKVLDISTKKYYDVKYDYQKSFERSPKAYVGYPLISNKFKIKDETLNHHHDSLEIYINSNEMSYGTNYVNYHAGAINSAGTRLSILENMDSIKVSITINGDLSVNPGKKLSLTAPKSIDPQVYKKIREKSAKRSSEHDMMISGDYIITGVQHVFSDKYTCEAVLKRDYSYYTLDSAE